MIYVNLGLLLFGLWKKVESIEIKYLFTNRLVQP